MDKLAEEILNLFKNPPKVTFGAGTKWDEKTLLISIERILQTYYEAKLKEETELIKKGLSALKVLATLTKTIGLTIGETVAKEMISEFDEYLKTRNNG